MCDLVGIVMVLQPLAAVQMQYAVCLGVVVGKSVLLGMCAGERNKI